MNKNTDQNLLNELFSLDRQVDADILKQYILNRNIKFG